MNEEEIKKAKRQLAEIKEYHKELFGDKETGEGVDNSIKSEIGEFDKKIREYRKELFGDKETGEGVDTSIKTETQKLYEKIKEYYKELFGGGDESSDSYVKSRIQALEKEIEDLLPRAGAAGLASAYFEAKSAYGLTPYKAYKPYKREEGLLWGFIWTFVWLWGYIRHLIAAYIPLGFNYILFIVPLLAIVWVFIGFHAPSLDFPGLPAPESDSYIDVENIVLRFFVSTPLSIIGLFGWTSIRFRRRLYEEYNHKQRVMQLYHSFLSEIDKDKNAEQKDALLAILLHTVHDKPASIMGKYDKDPSNIFKWLIDKIKNGIVSFMKKKSEDPPDGE